MTYGGHINKANTAYCGKCGKYRKQHETHLDTKTGKTLCKTCHSQVRLKPNNSRSTSRHQRYTKKIEEHYKKLNKKP